MEAGVQLCQASNDDMARFCSAYPDRLWWLANLPMQDPNGAVAAYRRAASEGCRGAAIRTSIAGGRLDEDRFQRFWASAEELGLRVLIHPAFNEPHAALTPYYLQNVIGNPLETTITVERLICSGVLLRHPGVRLVLPHGGGFLPYQGGRLCHASAVRGELANSPADIWGAPRQLYFDTISHDVEALRYLVRRVGASQVILGTDMPYDMGMQTPMDTLAEALDEATVERIAGRNPAELFGLDDPVTVPEAHD